MKNTLLQFYQKLNWTLNQWDTLENNFKLMYLRQLSSLSFNFNKEWSAFFAQLEIKSKYDLAKKYMRILKDRWDNRLEFNKNDFKIDRYNHLIVITRKKDNFELIYNLSFRNYKFWDFENEWIVLEQ